MKFFSQKKGIYKSWIMSYFSLIAVFFILFNGAALLSRELLEDKILQSNKSVFGFICSELGNMKNELDNMSIQIMLNDDVIDMFKETNHDNNYYLKINTIRKDLQNLMVSNGYVEKVILYKHKEDVFFDDGGLFDAKKQFLPYSIKGHTDIQKGFEDWKYFITKRHNQELYTTDNGEVIYINSISVQNEIQGTIIVVLNKEKIENIFRSMQSDLDVNFLILNNMNEPVYSLKEDKVKLLAEQMKLELSPGQHSVKAGNDSIVVYVSEQKSNLKCLYAIPSTVFYNSTNLLMTIIFILTVLFVAVGLIFALYNSKRNYMPVKKLLGLLKEYQYENSKKHDEFTFINATLSDMLSKGLENKITKMKYNKKLFVSEFVRFLTDNVCTRSIEEVFELYNISFSYSKYIAAAVLVDRIDDSVWEESVPGAGTTEDELVEVAFSNVYGEILGDDYNILIVGLNNMYFCLIGTNIYDEEKIKKDISEGFKLTKIFAKENIGIAYSLYASEIFEDLRSLKKMYNQINSTYMFNLLIDKNILFYDEINYTESELDSGSSAEDKLSSAVQKGKIDDIKSLIARMIIQNDATESPLQLAYVKYSILNILSNSIQYASKYNGDIYLLVDEVNRSSSVIEFLRPLLEFVESLCALQDNNSKMGNADVVDRLIKYINHNYTDSNMNVDQLGAEFSLSPSYLSNLFKLKTGEMLRDYIAKVRLQNARKMLLAGIKIKDVATKSGFASSKSFVRAFKRYFGTTPSQYKKENEG